MSDDITPEMATMIAQWSSWEQAARDVAALRADLAAAKADVARLREVLQRIQDSEAALAVTIAPPSVPLADAEALAMALEGLLADVRRQPPNILMREHDGVFVALVAFRAKHAKP